MSGDTELKPCPDGHEAEKRPHINGIAGRFLARCSRLDCGWRNVQMTPEQWNRRTTPPGLETVPEGTMDAMTKMMEHYLTLVNSGDAGNWEPEDEPEVIACRAILTRHRAPRTRLANNGL